MRYALSAEYSERLGLVYNWQMRLLKFHWLRDYFFTCGSCTGKQVEAPIHKLRDSRVEPLSTLLSYAFISKEDGVSKCLYDKIF